MLDSVTPHSATTNHSYIKQWYSELKRLPASWFCARSHPISFSFSKRVTNDEISHELNFHNFSMTFWNMCPFSLAFKAWRCNINFPKFFPGFNYPCELWALTHMSSEALTHINSQALTHMNSQALTHINSQALTIINRQAMKQINC